MLSLVRSFFSMQPPVISDLYITYFSNPVFFIALRLTFPNFNRSKLVVEKYVWGYVLREQRHMRKLSWWLTRVVLLMPLSVMVKEEKECGDFWNTQTGYWGGPLPLLQGDFFRPQGDRGAPLCPAWTATLDGEVLGTGGPSAHMNEHTEKTSDSDRRQGDKKKLDFSGASSQRLTMQAFNWKQLDFVWHPLMQIFIQSLVTAS